MEWSIEWLIVLVVVPCLGEDNGTTTETVLITTEWCEDANCTMLNETIISSTTPEAPKINTTKEPKKQGVKKKKISHGVCWCDLQLDICDVNCCCDPSCSPSDKSLFKYCQRDPNRVRDDSLCHYKDLFYINNTEMVKWEANSDGLFCVVSRYVPASRTVQREGLLRREEVPVRSFWGYHEVPEVKLNATYYRFGDPVWVVKDGVRGLLSLPDNFLSAPCSIGVPVKFLQDAKSSCGQTVLDGTNSLLNFSTFYDRIRVISNPKILNLTGGVPVESLQCDRNLKNCSNKKVSALFCQQNRCQNALKKLHYRLYHNGTGGVQKVLLLAHLDNVRGEFSQEYSLEFLWLNTTRNYSKIFSGNPGYIVGKPVLIKTNATLRNSTEFLDNFLTIPGNVRGRCVKNYTHYDPIEFGYNSLTKCSIQGGNATGIFSLYGVPLRSNVTRMFGAYGNGGQWGEILYEGLPKCNMTRAACKNLTTRVDIKVFYVRVDIDETVLNQNKILGVKVCFGNKEVEKQGLIELVTQVSFHDVTGVKQKKFVDPPSLDARLPYDFFYPFVKLGNGGVTRGHWGLKVVLTTFVLIHTVL
ncbi:tectonic-3 [Anthonomus grandis grandis]|uniref:tectonic-3 n=1 Tax=Anthonomus grandis grandis TaxID=2921223 RepID=UPI00216550DC|nr:tectonic-3 [Anthonomus grandis grandis]